MSIPPAPVMIPGNTADLVNSGWNQFSAQAAEAFDMASGFIEALGSYEIEAVEFEAGFTPPQDLLSPFRRPLKPEDPELDFSFVLPDPIEVEEFTVPDFGTPPENDAQLAALDFSGEPSPLNIPAPDAPPAFDEAPLPEPPTLNFPELPDLIELDLPDKPELQQHQFEGERPEIDFEAPDAYLGFQEEEYQSELLDRLTAEIKRVLDDGTGMPPVVEQMLVDRASHRENIEAARAVQEATERWGARGFSLPSGLVNRDIERAKQNNQNQTNTFNREVFIQRRQEEIEHFRFAVAQGIALENINIQAHLNVMQRAFDFARASADLVFRKFESQVALYNAQIQGYRTDAEVYRSLIEAESQKLEQYRSELQAEALKNEINRDRIALYTARLESLNTIVRVYTAQIEAAQAITQRNATKAQAYAAQIQAYRARVDAKTSEFQAWATKVQGQLGKVQAYEAEVRAFLADVQAYDTKVRSQALEPQLHVELQQSKVNQVLAQLENARTGIQAEEARIRGRASVFGAKAQMYSADGQMAANETDANTRAFQTKLAEQTTKSERALAQAQLNVEQVLRSGQILAQAIDGAARSSSQLSAGAMSAVNLSASMNEGFNQQIGKSWSYNTTQRIDDSSSE